MHPWRSSRAINPSLSNPSMYQSMKKRPFGRGNNILATVFLGTKIDHHIVSNYSPPSERGVSFLANGLNYTPLYNK